MYDNKLQTIYVCYDYSRITCKLRFINLWIIWYQYQWNLKLLIFKAKLNIRFIVILKMWLKTIFLMFLLEEYKANKNFSKTMLIV